MWGNRMLNGAWCTPLGVLSALGGSGRMGLKPVGLLVRMLTMLAPELVLNY